MIRILQVLSFLLICFQLNAQKIIFEETFNTLSHNWKVSNDCKHNLRNSEIVLEAKEESSEPKLSYIFDKNKQESLKKNFSIKLKIRFLGKGQEEHFAFYMASNTALKQYVSNSGKSKFESRYNTSEPSIAQTNDNVYHLEILRLEDKVFSYVNNICVGWSRFEEKSFDKISLMISKSSKIAIDFVKIFEVSEHYFSKKIIKRNGKYIGVLNTLAYQLPFKPNKRFFAYINQIDKGRIIAVKDTKSGNSVAVSVEGSLPKTLDNTLDDFCEILLTPMAMSRIGKSTLIPVTIDYNTDIGVWLADLNIARDSNRVHIYHKLYKAYQGIDNQKALYYLNQGLSYAKAIKFNNGISTSYILLAQHHVSIHKKTADLKLIKSYHEKAIFAQKRNKNDDKLAQKYKTIGDFYALKLADLSTAKSYYLLWLQTREKQNKPKYLLWGYRFLGRLEMQQNNYNSAFTYFGKYLKVSEGKESQDKYHERLKLLANEVKVVAPQRAIDYYEKVLKYLRIKGKKAYEMSDAVRLTYLTWARKEKNKGNLTQAKKIYIKLLERTHFEYIEDVQMLYALYSNESKYNECLELLKKYCNILVKDRPKGNLPSLLFYELQTIRPLYKKSASRIKSIGFLEQWLKELRNPAYKFLRYKVLSELQIVCQANGDFKKAAEYGKEAFSLVPPKDISKEVKTLDDIAFLYQKSHNYTEAQKYYAQALDIRNKEGHPLLIAEQLNKMGYMFQMKGSKKANKYYKNAYSICKGTGIKKSDLKALGKNNIRRVFTQFSRVADFYKKKGSKKSIKFEEIANQLIGLLE